MYSMLSGSLKQNVVELGRLKPAWVTVTFCHKPKQTPVGKSFLVKIINKSGQSPSRHNTITISGLEHTDLHRDIFQWLPITIQIPGRAPSRWNLPEQSCGESPQAGFSFAVKPP